MSGQPLENYVRRRFGRRLNGNANYASSLPTFPFAARVPILLASQPGETRHERS